MQSIRHTMFALLGSTLFSTIVSAAAMSPPEPSLRKPPAAWIGYALMFVFLAIIITISLMSSKRGHQD